MKNDLGFKLMITAAIVIILFVLIMPNDSLDDVPIIGSLRETVKSTGLTESLNGIFGDIQRQLYKLSHNGEDPPLDFIRVTCDTQIINSLLVDAEIKDDPICKKSDPIDKYDCGDADTFVVQPQAIPILEDVGSLIVYANSNQIDRSNYGDLKENEVRKISTDKCLNKATPYLEFKLFNNKQNEIDYRRVFIS